jgi:hypothetical protein
MKWIDRGLAVLLALGSAGHGFVGTLMTSPLDDPGTVWSFSGSVAAWLIAALNWMRTSRPGDRVLAFWALIGALAWAGLMLWLMWAAQMWSDPRPWSFIAICAALALFSLRGMRAG